MIWLIIWDCTGCYGGFRFVIGLHPVVIPFLDGLFPFTKTNHFLGTSIYGNPHIGMARLLALKLPFETGGNQQKYPVSHMRWMFVME